ncbi:cupin domain-containing protein [Ktedonobacter racemifer]|uniref:Cupin 2 conserved barrel domain protein n=1 Tax=Ktedonobacter racemifer DSM 44963 TaxID=485913 RepID=D6TEY8_KTERA|nr:cupin domain-containing protein [Ktedonobacter racemifer]EFH88587.1 Cupin 2 conserved barrel domain protein [Ktedonobacter racemifer DSM 44963]
MPDNKIGYEARKRNASQQAHTQVQTLPALQPLIRQPGEGISIAGSPEDPTAITLTGKETGGAFFLINAYSSVPNVGPPLHVHTREDETWYILEGNYEFRIGDNLVSASPGMTIFGPRNIPHTFHTTGSGHGHILILVTPAGLEDFFITMGQRIRQNALTPEGLEKLARQYGVSFLD